MAVDRRSQGGKHLRHGPQRIAQDQHVGPVLRQVAQVGHAADTVRGRLRVWMVAVIPRGDVHAMTDQPTGQGTADQSQTDDADGCRR